MSGLVRATTNIFLSLLLGAVALALCALYFPEQLEFLQIQANHFKDWLLSSMKSIGSTSAVNVWVRFLVKDEQLVFMGFVIVSRILLFFVIGIAIKAVKAMFGTEDEYERESREKRLEEREKAIAERERALKEREARLAERAAQSAASSEAPPTGAKSEGNQTKTAPASESARTHASAAGRAEEKQEAAAGAKSAATAASDRSNKPGERAKPGEPGEPGGPAKPGEPETPEAVSNAQSKEGNT